MEGRMSTAPTQLRRTDQIQDILRGLRTSSSEVIGAAIVSAEGFTAASLLPSEVDEEVVAGMGAALLGVATVGVHRRVGCAGIPANCEPALIDA